MSWAKNNESVRSMLFSLAVLSLAALGLWFGASSNTTSAKITSNAVPAATFNGSNLGAIPDATTGQCWGAFVPTPRNVTFNVSGLGIGAPTNVELSTTSSPIHSWVGDVRATLIAPNGASHIVFARTGSTTSGGSGDSSDLAGPYNFKDTAAGVNWWTEAANRLATEALTAGDYRTTSGGGVPGAGTNTSMIPAFSTVADANGTWTLRLEDGCAGDTGSISAASLILETAPVTPTGAKNVDYDGDGKSDFSIARDESPLALSGNNDFFRADSVREKLRIQAEKPNQAIPEGVGGPITWYNHRSLNGSDQVVNFGIAATDFLVPADYDGDLKSDITVWRPGAPGVAAFYILQSTDAVVRTELFGQTGDDTAITGDYDGDGKADVASYRCPALGAGDGQCFFYYRGSNANPGGNITFVPWGFGETFDFFVNPGDFDGDGKYDFCIQRTNPAQAGSGQFVLLKSNGGGIEYVTWGNNSDLIIPGDYDGDGKADFMVSRTVMGQRQNWLLRRTGQQSMTPWGIAGDVRTPGDYDGDGKTDLAIWRSNANPDMNFFWVLNSSNLSVTQYEYGQSGDFAVAAWLVH